MSMATSPWKKKVSESGDGDFVPCPPGNHPGRVAAIFDVGHHAEVFNGKAKDTQKLVIVFELSKKDSNGKPYCMAVRYTFSTNEKSNFFKVVQSMLGRAFQPGEEIDVESLLGLVVLVNVVHKPSGDKTYANVTSVSCYPEGMPQPTFQHEPILWSIQELPGRPFPEQGWLPRVYGKPIKQVVEESREVCGFSAPPVDARTTAAAEQSSPAGQCPPEIAGYLKQYGLPWPFDAVDLHQKEEDIPPRVMAALVKAADDIPF